MKYTLALLFIGSLEAFGGEHSVIGHVDPTLVYQGEGQDTLISGENGAFGHDPSIVSGYQTVIGERIGPVIGLELGRHSGGGSVPLYFYTESPQAGDALWLPLQDDMREHGSTYDGTALDLYRLSLQGDVQVDGTEYPMRNVLVTTGFERGASIPEVITSESHGALEEPVETENGVEYMNADGETVMIIGR